jgi:hypothetical protein
MFSKKITKRIWREYGFFESDKKLRRVKDMRKSRISVLAVVVMVMVFALGTIQNAWADGNSIKNAINTWATNNGVVSDIASVSGNDVIVDVNSVVNATSQLMISDSSGVTIQWKGDVIGNYPNDNFGGIINLQGSGTLEISGSISNNGSTVIESIGAWNITVKSNGKVENTGTDYDAEVIHLFSANEALAVPGGTITVESGGVVHFPYGTAINVHEYCEFDIQSGAKITGFVSYEDTYTDKDTTWVYGNVQNDLSDFVEDVDDGNDERDTSYLIIEDKATLTLVDNRAKVPFITEIKSGGTLIFEESAWTLKHKLTNHGRVIIKGEAKLTLDPDPGEIDNYGTVEIYGVLQNGYKYFNQPGATTTVAEGAHFYETDDAETVNNGTWNGKEPEPLNPPSSSGGGCTTGLGLGLLPLILGALVLSRKKHD